MKRISSLLISTSLLALVSGIASAATSLDSNWTCTTNASSSDVAADKTADNQMSANAKSAADAFSFASTNCRDCTKITCEVNDEASADTANGTNTDTGSSTSDE
jgi:hypothetical protein